MIKVLIIIPAYNESANIEATIQNLKKAQPTVDYIVINDCSTDSTGNFLKEMNENYVELPINLGIGGAMQTGYKYALQNDYDIAIQMDGDGQHIPEYIDALISPILNGQADVVIGSRFLDKVGFQSSWTRRLGINFLSALIYLCCGVKIKDVTSGFRAANKKAIQLFVKDYAQDYPEPEAIMTCALSDLIMTEVPVVMKEREGGTSSISNLKSLYYMVKVSLAILLKKSTLRRKK